MGQSNFYLSYSEETIKTSSRCARCGDNAEIHLALLGEMPQRGGSFCLPCSEAVLHDLQHPYALLGHASQSGADTAHPVPAHSTHHQDDSEQGIVWYEEHGWSSDGPFAGA